MTYLTRDDVQAFAVVIVRPAGDTLVREITFPYRPELDMETVTVDVAGLDDYQLMEKVMELIHEVAPHDTACWLGRAWKAEIPSSTPVWTTQG